MEWRETIKALIDGDILVYRVGYTTEDVPVQIAMSRMDEVISKIVSGTKASEFSVFLTATGHKCFRFTLYPEYKANRKTPKPLWYGELRAHLVSDYGALVTEELEADDAIGIAQNNNTIICSIDKDLDQISGLHYDFVKDTIYMVDEGRATRFFYFQLLTGDTTDNIKGIPGVGPKTAMKILNGLTTEKEFLAACWKAYKEAKLSLEYMTLQGQLLKIKQTEDEPLWVPNIEVDSKHSSQNISKEIKLTTSMNLST